MSTKMTPVTVAPMPTDRRVLALAAALGVTTRTAWAMAAESWAWLQAEAGDDGAVPGGPALLDAVVDVEGLGAALVTAGLVGATADGLVLPAELVRASRLLDGGGDVARDDRRRQKARERSRKWRKRTRLSGGTPATKTVSAADSGQQAAPCRRPRRLGSACGHDVMLLDGRYGAFVQLSNATPKCTATAEHLDFERVTLADALDLLVPIHKSHAPPGGGSRVPRLQALEDAARLERDRQRAADADAARQAEGNAALLEAAADAEDDAYDLGGDAGVTLRARHARHRDAPRDAVAEGESAASPSSDTDLHAGPRDAPRDAPRALDAASSSSSSSSSSVRAQIETTTRTAPGDRNTFECDETAPVQEEVPPWVLEERQARQRARAERWAAALGISVNEVRRQYREDKPGLRRRLEAAGVDPNTDRPFRGHSASATSGSSAAHAAGIPLPDRGVGRLRDVADRDADVDDVHDQDTVLDDDRGMDDAADLTPEPTSADAAS